MMPAEAAAFETVGVVRCAAAVSGAERSEATSLLFGERSEPGFGFLLPVRAVLLWVFTKERPLAAYLRRDLIEGLFLHFFNLDEYERAFLKRIRSFTLSKLYQMTEKQVKYLILLDMKHGTAWSDK